MRIITVCPYYFPASCYGGPFECIRRCNVELHKRGHPITVCTTTANGQGDFAASNGHANMIDGIPVFYHKRLRRFFPDSYFRCPDIRSSLSTLARQNDIASLHGVFTHPNRTAAAVFRSKRTPYVVYTHGSFDPAHLRYKKTKKLLYTLFFESSVLKYASAIIVCNSGEQAWLESRPLRCRIERIHWGCDLIPDNVPLFKTTISERWPMLVSKPYILYLGRIHSTKGLGLLIPAFAQLKNLFRDWMLVIAGPGETNYKSVIDDLIFRLDLADRIVFTGMVEGDVKRALLKNASLFVLPSYFDGFSLAVTEALGAGIACLITKGCYMPEVGYSNAGLVVEPDVDSIRDGVRILMEDSSTRDEFGKNAFTLASSRFTWESVAKQTIGLFQEILNRSCR